MRRLLIITGLSVLGAILLLALAAGFMLNTGPGRSLIVSIAEPRLGAALKSEAEIGALEGRLPGEIILRDVKLAADGEIWLAADELALRWRPFAALRGRIEIDTLAVNGATLFALPPKNEEEAQEVSPPLRLPDAFPAVTVRRFSISRLALSENVATRPASLDASGALAMGGRALSLRAEANSPDGGDQVDIAVELNPGGDTGALDILVTSPADGFIASLLELGGPLTVEAHGEAPLSSFSATLTGDIGTYLVLDARLSGDLRAATSLGLDADVVLGERLADIAEELGDELSFEARLSERRNGARLEIARFESAAGAAAGNVEWTTRGETLRTLQGAVDIAFAEDWRPDVQALAGERAKGTFAVRPRGGDYAVEATLETPRGALALNEGRSDLRERLTGLLTLDMAPASDAPGPLADGAAAQARFSFEKDRRVALDDFVMSVDDGSEATGEAAYDFAAGALAVSGNARLAPATLASLAPQVAASGPVTARFNAGGPVDRLEAQIDLDAPALTVNETAVPAMTGSLRAAGFPDALNAEIVGRASDGRGRIEARIRRDGAAYLADPVRVEGVGFSLAGRVRLNPETERVTLDLKYRGEENAEPWPGFPLSGEIDIAGGLGRKADANDVTLTAQGVTGDGFSVASLTARATGPASAVRVEATGENIAAPELGAAETMALTAVADLGDPIVVTLNRFDGVLRGAPVALVSPATFRFADGAEVSGFNAAIGRRGRLTADAAFSGARWRAVIAAERIPVREASAHITFTVDLDTDRETVASGDFLARSLLTDLEEAGVGGRFVWDGQSAHVTNSESGDPIDLDIRLPARLVRTPSLSVDVTGEISGRASYDGLVQPLAAYLPPTLQSLEGNLSGAVTLAGTMENPAITGRLTLSDGSYTELVSGLSLKGVRLDAEASAATGETVVTFTAGAMGAKQTAESITAEGRVTLGEAPAVDSVVRLDNAVFAAGPVADATASGDVTIKGPFERIVASGALTVSELNAEIITPEAPGLVEINVVPLNGEGEEIPRTTDAAEAPPIVLDIGVKAADRIFVRGRGLESEWRADIRATGEAQEPLIIGAMSLVRGYLDFAGRRFTLTTGSIAFDRLSPNNPVLNMRAEFETSEGVLAAIEIKGRALSPSVSLVSTPSLPSEDIMALVLFGKPATELSAIESLQIAQALASLGGIGPFGGGGLAGGARQALGLDMLNVDFDSATGASSLEVGKYVADGLFVSATQDAKGQSGAVRVEYQVTNSISVETQIRQDGDQKVSANWKRDF